MAKSRTYETFKAIKAITGKRMIVSYVRDEETREPIGVVVAFGKDIVGWSKRKGKGKWNANAGIIQAYVGAVRGDDIDTIPDTNKKFRAIRDAFAQMEERSREYYRLDHPVQHGAIIVAGQVRA
jgi:hypothetical protein